MSLNPLLADTLTQNTVKYVDINNGTGVNKIRIKIKGTGSVFVRLNSNSLPPNPLCDGAIDGSDNGVEFEDRAPIKQIAFYTTSSGMSFVITICQPNQ